MVGGTLAGCAPGFEILVQAETGDCIRLREPSAYRALSSRPHHNRSGRATAIIFFRGSILGFCVEPAESFWLYDDAL